ncbi:SET domain-containing protein-lysine N-methyltransferase [Brevibacillus fluminis]|uniref:SET domain-containing protein-lysine N-methyltransferase n=1 Tax=Brevibacillus fluminis TaxID=511487 RepID=A0A3M8DUB7_9BACL|nr:SET domain-containing protein [Brevibacillus fluminis]RNB91075.1 SET domain-containing protein-lysine N-methyltransferase [Brevibacillus fluminis]
MIHPHTELRYINEVIGYGVFATQFIPKGTIVWALDDLDQILEEKAVNELEPLRQVNVKKYSYRNQHGKYVLCWDNGKFVNHSFRPTCAATAYEIELASRDIYPGEELTDDYGTLNLDEPFHCLPETGENRTVVLPDDLLRYHQQWDQLAADAFQCFLQVKQPLFHLIKPEYVEQVLAVAHGKMVPETILSTYHVRA